MLTKRFASCIEVFVYFTHFGTLLYPSCYFLCLSLGSNTNFPNFQPLQVREHDPSKFHKVEYLGVHTKNSDKTKKLIGLAQTLESGRRVACDIGDCDPERMAPPKVQEYVTQLFANSNIKMRVVSDEQEIKREFPLFEAVNRAASIVERHRGRIIFLEYNPPEAVKDTLYFVGKGRPLLFLYYCYEFS